MLTEEQDREGMLFVLNEDYFNEEGYFYDKKSNKLILGYDIIHSSYTEIEIKGKDIDKLPKNTYEFRGKGKISARLSDCNTIDNLYDYDGSMFVQDVFTSRFINEEYAFKLFPELKPLIGDNKKKYFILHKANITHIVHSRNLDELSKIPKKLLDYLSINEKNTKFCDLNTEDYFDIILNYLNDYIDEYNSTDAYPSYIDRDGCNNLCICKSLLGYTFYANLSGD
jgi:effector-binding domain-containing protein